MKKALKNRLEAAFVTSAGVMNMNHLGSKLPEPAMAESKGKEREEKNEELSKLIPLSLPHGVTPEIAARLTTSILMRRVYCSTCPWTQWILLASVGILHGQETPKLDSVGLHLLQGTVNEKLVSRNFISEEDCNRHLCDVKVKKTDILGENTSDDTALPFALDDKNVDVGLGSTFNVNRTHEESSPVSQEMAVTGDKHASERSSPSLKKSTIKTSQISPTQNNQLENENTMRVNLHSQKDLKEKHNQKTWNVPPKQNNISNIQIHPLLKDITFSGERKQSVSQESVGVQVTPRKLGILTSKWVQVRVPKRIDAVMQTELIKSEYVDIKSQSNEYIGCLPKEFADKEVQTLLKIKRDKISQTGNVDIRVDGETAQREWIMISLSDVPNKKCGEPTKKGKSKNNVNNNQGEDDDLAKDSEGNKIESSTIKRKHYFHGRPLLQGKSLNPLEIPLYSSASIVDANFQDPRLCFKSDSS